MPVRAQAVGSHILDGDEVRRADVLGEPYPHAAEQVRVQVPRVVGLAPVSAV